ncbi:3-oxoacyl-[acyl-carrier-protein] reductase FabG [Colletotrichum spaethianum]|uniref:Peroxisomal trans-2-enoyl-CoA reductase n=1 Tax=Colletotrichum spaethianum TaxID=700344 RepID=A0AA37L7S2_9PEZI|nr:3-oxoacyl-[acyl-carrier-protein] reductase FabG [Colletotrichum spaethianum]GKT42189.1 3-oxoacyl-[acyl-carrier-protein] reductase FabG [Colletotrichum spaethianum]
MDLTADFSPYRADGKLYGFVCVVTGAAQPVGRAIVEELAVCDKTTSDETFKSLVTKVHQEHPNTKVIPYPFNVAKEEETLVLIDELLNAFGRLDIWVSSAGLLGPPSIAETTPADLQRCFEAHSMAPFFALKYAPPAMAKLTEKQAYPNAAPKTQKYGSIIVISSVASWGPSYTMSAYGALGVVKAGVAVLKGTGVRINCISPGQIDVGLDLNGLSEASIGLERPGSPQEVARVAGFLASGFSSYITGANLVVDGGSSAMNPLTVPLGKA